MAGIYFHIPFCKQACHYCDFHFSTNLQTRAALVTAMRHELQLQKSYLDGELVDTIYFGGGTPSLLTPAELRSLLNDCRRLFSVITTPEVTLEANPDDLSSSMLAELKDVGFNRLSIGIQAFQDGILRFMNRAHDASMALNAVRESRAAGFKNISVDLIYAIPGLTDEMWQANIEKTIALDPDHISAYSLTIEPKTVFGNWNAKGTIHPVKDDLSARQLEMLVSTLQRAGYQQYEVSNFSKPGFESKHNSSYWQRKCYLGIGPSAHSYNKISRQFNVRNNNLYIKSLEQGTVPFEKEILSREDEINEYLMTTLRTIWGADLEFLNEDLQYDLLTERNALIKTLLSEGLAILDDHHLKLTQRGKMMADKITEDLFLIS